MTRVVFMGTPAYALPALEVVRARSEAVWVVTRPDARSGRGRRLTPSPVRARAEALGLPTWTPTAFTATEIARLRDWAPDLLVTAAYGLILPPEVLAVPRLGAYNLHASLLPRWRGANPIAWAIRAGDSTTGVTLMRMDAGVDTGPVVDAVATPILDTDTTGDLTERLAHLAADLLDRWWAALAAGTAPTRPQVGVPTRARRFRPEEAHVTFDLPAGDVWRLVRSMLPEPGPYTIVDNVRVTLLDTWPQPDNLPVGTVRIEGEQWIIGCRTGSLAVRRVKPAGGRPMTPEAFRRGRPHLALVIR